MPKAATRRLVATGWAATLSSATHSNPLSYTFTSMLNKFRQGAQRAGSQASVFLRDGSTKIANESANFVQGFSLPGEAEKAARILQSFLGKLSYLSLLCMSQLAERDKQQTHTTQNPP